MTQPTVSKHWRRVVSYPDRSQSHQAHLTMLTIMQDECLCALHMHEVKLKFNTNTKLIKNWHCDIIWTFYTTCKYWSRQLEYNQTDRDSWLTWLVHRLQMSRDKVSEEMQRSLHTSHAQSSTQVNSRRSNKHQGPYAWCSLSLRRD